MVFYGFSRIQGRHGWFIGYVVSINLLMRNATSAFSAGFFTLPLEYNFYSPRSLRHNPVVKSINYIMCDAATHDTVHDAVHDAVLGTPSLEYRYPTLRKGGFTAEEYSQFTLSLGAYYVSIAYFSIDINTNKQQHNEENESYDCAFKPPIICCIFDRCNISIYVYLLN